MGFGMTPGDEAGGDIAQWRPIGDIAHCDGVEVAPYMHWWAETNRNKEGAANQCNLAQADCVQRHIAGGSCKELVSVPQFAQAPSGTAQTVPQDLAQKTTPLPPNTVITGIIDEGIALGHARFRKMNEGSPIATRVIGAWQQGARYGGPDGSTLQTVPFGHVLLQSEIDALMIAHSANGWLDEEAFNLAAGLTERSEPMGVATLDRLVAHGTHVLDLAAGFDPVSTAAATLEQRPILAVTLPRRETVGMSGTFLQFFVAHAMQWIADMADALWKQHYPDKEGGFPVVLNLSFGQHAGPKNATSQIEKAFRALKKKRHETAPLCLVMPVGNDNLARGNSYTSFAIGSSGTKPILELPWRIQPEDYSTNFMEIWVEIDGPQPDTHHPLILDIQLPTGQTVAGITGQHAHYLDLPGAARIYAEKTQRCDPDDPLKIVKQLYRYVICTSATLDQAGAHSVSPAGVWQITAQWNCEDLDCTGGNEAKLYCSVQVDQAVEVGSLRNRRSYFDHRDYDVFDDTGRLTDTYKYPTTGKSDDLWDGGASASASAANLVQRRGTNNSIATDTDIVVVGGYRRSDGRPAPYSATNHAYERAPYGAAKQMTASLPTETAPAHFGLRAAGSRSSALVNLRGTSFAAGHATRQIVERLIEARKNGEVFGSTSGPAQTYAEFADHSEKSSSFEGKAGPLKIGHGRICTDPMPEIDRLTWGGGSPL